MSAKCACSSQAPCFKSTKSSFKPWFQYPFNQSLSLSLSLSYARSIHHPLYSLTDGYAIGEQVLIVNGKYRGQAGLIEGKNDKDFKVDVRLLSSTTNDLVSVDYDFVSQLEGENGSNPSVASS